MSSLLRRRPLPRRSIDGLDPAVLGRDVRALTGPVVQSRALRRTIAAAARIVSLMAVDVAGVAIALYAGLAIRDELSRGRVLWGIIWRAESAWLPFIALVLVLVFARAGLYRSAETRPRGGTIIASLALTTVVIAGFAFATGHRSGTYAVWLWTLGASAVVIPSLRLSFDIACWSLLRGFGRTHRIVLVGAEDEVAPLAHAFASNDHGPPIVVVRSIPSTTEIEAVLDELAADDVVLARPPDDTTLLEVLETCRRNGVRLRVVPSAVGVLAREAVYVSGQAVPLFEITPPTIQGLDWLVKRAFDLVVALLLLVVLAPFRAIIALLVRLTSAGPVIYRDVRIGIGERPFETLKFRSMREGAAAEQAALEDANEADGAIFKIRDDPRLTPIGGVLRRYSLDELPQLWNVLRGEMSLIGPRPLPMRDYERLADWHHKRYLVIPGITGLWQISGRSDLGFDEMVRLDFYYLEHWSIWLDISILARTPAAILIGRGAF